MAEMRLLMGAEDVLWFREHFPMFKWEAGDTKIRWNANDPDEVAMAQKAFEAYKQKHPKAIAFRVKPNDEKEATHIKEFDPLAEYIVMQEYAMRG